MMPKTLKQYREEKYMSVEEFAEYLDVAADTLYRIQRGEKPRFSTMKKIARKLKVQPAEISEFSRE